MLHPRRQQQNQLRGNLTSLGQSQPLAAARVCTPRSLGASVGGAPSYSPPAAADTAAGPSATSAAAAVASSPSVNTSTLAYKLFILLLVFAASAKYFQAFAVQHAPSVLGAVFAFCSCNLSIAAAVILAAGRVCPPHGAAVGSAPSDLPLPPPSTPATAARLADDADDAPASAAKPSARYFGALVMLLLALTSLEHVLV